MPPNILSNVMLDEKIFLKREIANTIKETFESVKWFKPNSCRKNSFETFLIGINYKGQPPKPDNDADIFNDDNYTGEMPW